MDANTNKLTIKKPCLNCKRKLPLYASFRPRWRGCIAHALPSGRRTFVLDCEDCQEVVASRTRQPRCIDCDKDRMSLRKVYARREDRVAGELRDLARALRRRTG
jgi:hypothetical protein